MGAFQLRTQATLCNTVSTSVNETHWWCFPFGDTSLHKYRQVTQMTQWIISFLLFTN